MHSSARCLTAGTDRRRSASDRGSLLAELRQGTLADHRALERVFDLDFWFSSPRRYRALLERLLALHRPLERQITRHLPSGPMAFDYLPRTPHLLDDLRALGATEAGIAAIGDHVLDDTFDDPMRRAGALYVLEGSRLGARVISRVLASRPFIAPGRANRYYGSDGPQDARRWRDFTAALDRFGEPFDPAQRLPAIAAARGLFAHFARLSTPPREPSA